mgnify:CR=1 FL=1
MLCVMCGKPVDPEKEPIQVPPEYPLHWDCAERAYDQNRMDMAARDGDYLRYE